MIRACRDGECAEQKTNRDAAHVPLHEVREAYPYRGKPRNFRATASEFDAAFAAGRVRELPFTIRLRERWYLGLVSNFSANTRASIGRIARRARVASGR